MPGSNRGRPRRAAPTVRSTAPNNLRCSGVAERTVGAALRVFIIMTCFTDRYHDILYS